MADPLLAKYGTSRSGHALFAPSAAASWLTCSGSLLVNARAADDAGIEAAYGTVAHWLAERWLSEGEEPRDCLGVVRSAEAGGTRHRIEIDEEMFALVGQYVNWCLELPGSHFFEQRVDLSEIMPIPGQGGTADHVACERGVLTITDLKTGMIRVHAEENPQALLYAAGAFIEHDWIYGFKQIVIRICQPRLGVFDVWECTRDDLLEFMEYARARALLAWDEDARRTPTPKACRWCRGRVTCPARLRDIERIVDDTFSDLTEEHPDEPPSYGAEAASATPGAMQLPKAMGDAGAIKPLSTAALSLALTYRKHVEGWFAAVADELLDRVERGDKAPHWGLKNGRQTRSWKDEKEAAHYLHDLRGIAYEDIYPPSPLVSPSRAEELLATEARDKPAAAKKSLLPYVNSFAGRRTLGLLKEDERENVDDVIDATFTASE